MNIILDRENVKRQLAVMSRARRGALSAFTRVFDALGAAPQNRDPLFFE